MNISPGSANNFTSADRNHMARALQLARRGLYTTMPNPRVGCVLVKSGEIIGEGWHQWSGEAHAEINALNAATAMGHSPRNAEVYLSLEPCSHHGKTGPCVEALIGAGVGSVVYAMQDPNPQVSGRGLEQLRQAGITVRGPLQEDPARAINPGFIKRMEQGLPFVRIKLAMSLDGRTAMASGESKWITGAPARRDVQRWRARSCAVVSGINSLLKDNSSLTVRENELDLPGAESIAKRQPLRVVLDSQGQLPTDANVLAKMGNVLVVNVTKDIALPTDAHIEQVTVAGSDGRVDLTVLLRMLADRQCNEVLIETGATLAGAFLQQGLVDELIVYMAPKLLGSRARPLFDLPIDSMAGQLSLDITDIRAIGDDWRITAIPDAET